MNPEHKNGLFKEFPSVTTQEWEEKIKTDLKGADYERKLIWKTLEDIPIKPYYRGEDLKDLPFTTTKPGEFPFVRGNKIKGNHWEVRQDIEEPDPVKAGKTAWDILQKGANGVGLDISKVEDTETISRLLQNINLEKDQVHFLHSKNYIDFFYKFAEFAKKSGLDITRIKGSMDFDPLCYYLLYNKFYGTKEQNFKDTQKIIALAKQDLPSFKILHVNGQHYHNAGGNTIQELAFTLSQGNEYLVQLTDIGVPVDDITPRMQFTLATGSEFFKEIAKFRALRMLWAKVVKEYNPQKQKSLQTNIHATSSRWNKSIYDPYVNMLRTTTEIMAGGMAGVESISATPFDSTFKKPDDFSMRVARNQQIILQNEAFLNKVSDPGGGSYYIENITDALAQKAWEMFVEMEKKGGYIELVKSGYIKQSIEETANKKEMLIASRKTVFVGVNQYANNQEKMIDKIRPTAKLSDLGGLKTWRGPQIFETLRMSTENYTQKGQEAPLVYLFTYGNLGMRKARASFSHNFFACAGYNIQEAPMVKDMDDAIDKAVSYQPSVIVFCSSDEEYAQVPELLAPLADRLHNTHFVVAGHPKSQMETLQNAGINHFIHMKSNALELLKQFHDLLGIV